MRKCKSEIGVLGSKLNCAYFPIRHNENMEWSIKSSLFIYFLVAMFDLVSLFIYFHCEFVIEFVWLVENERGIGGFQVCGSVLA